MNEQITPTQVKEKTKVSAKVSMIILMVGILGVGIILGLALYPRKPAPPVNESVPTGPVIRSGWPVSGYGNPIDVNLVNYNTTSLPNQKGVVVVIGNTVTVLNPAGKPLTGWPKQVEADNGYVPATGDVNGDGKMEIVGAFFKQGLNEQLLVSRVYVWDTAGNLVTGWPKEFTSEMIEAPVVLADLNNDGKKDIIVVTSVSSSTAYSSDSWFKKLLAKEVKAQVDLTSKTKIYVFDYNKNLLAGWPKEIANESITSTPAVGNIDPETIPEIVICGFNKIYAFHANGSDVAGWPIDFKCLNDPSPVIANLATKENYSQVIAVSSESKNISVWNGDGSLVTGWPKTLDIRPFSLIVTDFNPYSSTNTNTVSHSQNKFIKEAKAQVYIGPAILVGGAYESQAGAALDKNKDNLLIKKAQAQVSIDPTSKIYAFNSIGDVLSGWPVSMYGNDVFYHGLSAADTDGKGVKVFAVTTTTMPDVPKAGKIFAYDTNGQIASGWPLQTAENYPATPTFADLDNNGYLEMVVRVMDKIYVWDLNTKFDPNKLLWPMFMHDSGHTNKY